MSFGLMLLIKWNNVVELDNEVLRWKIMSKLLLIGPRINKKDPSKTGGIIVLFEDLVKQCDKNALDYYIVDSNKSNYKNKAFAYIAILFQFLLNIKNASYVSLHGTANDYLLLAPIVIFFSKLFGKDVSLRKFAGNFDEIYDNSSLWKKKVFNYVLQKSDINFFETKYLVDKFKVYNPNTFWFPNVRDKSDIQTDCEYKKRFIFLGQVKEEKGVKEILEVSNLLDASYTIDLYGKLSPEIKDIDLDQYKANYRGALTSDEVQTKLAQYDVLLLPTFWQGEGYPGVIIEALSVGLPIVASTLKGIKEMVDDSSSVLMEPKSVEQLKEAIESFNESNYAGKSTAALKQFENFDSEIQTKVYFTIIGVIDNG